MNCPRCGQEMISVNGREACTSCGIFVGENQTPKDQVLGQIQKKAEQVQSPVNPEPYISPTEYHNQNNAPESVATVESQKEANDDLAEKDSVGEVPDFPIPASPDGKIKEKSAEDQKVQETQQPVSEEETPETPPQPETQGQINLVEQAEPSVSSQPIEDILVQENTEKKEPETSITENLERVNPDEKVIVPNQDFASSVKVEREKEEQLGEKFQSFYDTLEQQEARPQSEDTKIIYPSKEVNFSIIKPVIISGFVVAALAVGYYIYQSKGSIWESVINIAENVGEKLFQ